MANHIDGWKPPSWVLTGLAVTGGVGLAVAIVGVVSSSSGGSTSPTSPAGLPVRTGLRQGRRTAGARILLVGDSLAQGLTKPLGALANDSQVFFRGHGEVSTTISNWASRPWLAQDLAIARPTLVLMSLGTNDAKLTSPAAEKPALAKILAAIDATGAEVVLVAPPTLPFADRGVRALLAETGRLVYPSDALSIQRGPDHLHPTVLGYGSWAAALWQWLG